MKKHFALFILALSLHQMATAQCSVGSYTVSGNAMITGSCTITGDLTLLNGSTLNVDLTGASADTFVVRGNILLQGNAYLWIHSSTGSTNDQFIVSNSFSNQRTITTQDSSHLVLENMEFRTQEGDLTGASSIYMNLNAQDNSIVYINKSRLDGKTAWLLGNLYNKSVLQGFEPDGVPTEIYLQDSAAVVLHGPNTNTGLWLNFESITSTLTLPDQTQSFTWAVGRGAGGLATPWYLEVDTAKPGIGVQVMPSAHVTINGTGQPATGELTIGLLFANSTDTVKNLQVGLQNASFVNGRVILNNVKLHPIAWQLYALMNEHLVVKNSTVNEIGIAGPSTVVVDSSILQLAVLASVGQGGSSMTVNNSEIFNQAITAANNSDIVLNNCSVTGSVFSTVDTTSSIIVNGGCFFSNPTGCTQNTMVNIATGYPYCNPFIPAGFPQNLTPATVSFNGVNNNCTTGIQESAISKPQFAISPNPATNTLNLTVDESAVGSYVTVTDITGRAVTKFAIQNLQSAINTTGYQNGVYFISLNRTGGASATKKLIIQK